MHSDPFIILLQKVLDIDGPWCYHGGRHAQGREGWVRSRQVGNFRTHRYLMRGKISRLKGNS